MAERPRIAGRRRGAAVLLALATMLSLVIAQRATADVGDLGYEGPSTLGVGPKHPTGEKPESKLWHNDGHWWASFWSQPAQEFRIHRLDAVTHTWVDTGTTIDSRKDWRQDVLWDGQKLYVASHRFTSSVPGGGYRSDVLRFSYDSGTGSYALDAGFPVQINDLRTETLVIAKDGVGRLWATWQAADQVWVAHTNCTAGVCDDSAWAQPFSLATIPGIGTAAGTATDDISSVAAFGGDRVGVFWSSQTTGSFRFAFHRDGDPVTAWTLETPQQGTDAADDHVNIATSGGEVFVAVKTSFDRTGQPQTQLLKRAGGGWSAFTTSDGADNLTRPIVVVDPVSDELRYYLAENTGHRVFEKVTTLTAPSFGPGPGTAVLWDASADDMNDPTSTKQAYSPATGLVVAATDGVSERYFHHEVGLSAAALDAAFSTDVTSGTSPLTVSFTDASSGAPTTWSWEFGDGGTSDERNPTHTYTAPGLYTVTLRIEGPGGEDTETRIGLITVAPPVGPVASFSSDVTTGGAPLTVSFTDTSSGSPTQWQWDFGDGTGSTERHPSKTFTSPGTYDVTLTVANEVGGDSTTTPAAITVTASSTLTATADAIVRDDRPTKNYNTAELRVRTAGPAYRSIVQFDVPSVPAGGHIATLRLSSTDGSRHAGDVFVAASPIVEQAVTWASQPAIGSSPIAVGSSITTGDWAEWDVTGAVGGSGVVTFTLVSSSTDSAYYSSGEGPNAPQLVITPADGAGGPSAPNAAFTASPVSGTAPLAVQFTDASGGTPTSWTWDFGDGSPGSTEQHPLHVYDSVGQYTVTLTVTSPTGTDAAVTENLITVSDPASFATFAAVADAHVTDGNPTRNYGGAAEMRHRLGSPQYEVYLRFDVPAGTAGASMKLRAFVNDGGPAAGDVYTVQDGWDESGITWLNRPARSSPTPVATGTAVGDGTWYEWDVTAVLDGSATSYGFVIAGVTSNSVYFSSREGAQAPQLVVS
ncbi:MAG: PKD domain-containing protein [Acidimicrobiia bacterium]